MTTPELLDPLHLEMGAYVDGLFPFKVKENYNHIQFKKGASSRKITLRIILVYLTRRVTFIPRHLDPDLLEKT